MKSVLSSIGILAWIAAATAATAAVAATEPVAVAPPRFVPPRVGTAPAPKPASIRFVTADDFPPFSFLDGAGRLTGYDVELARALCDRLAVPCTIQVRPFPLLVETVVSNQADAIVAGLRDTARLRRFVTYTASYLKLPARFVMRRDDAVDAVPETLAGMSVAVPRGTRYRDFLVDFFPGVTLVDTNGMEEALAKLHDGTVDAAFGGALAESFWLAGQDSDGCCRFAGGPYTEPAYFGPGLSIAVAAGNTGLRDALDDALRGVEADGVTTDLYMRFFPVGLY